MDAGVAGVIRRQGLSADVTHLLALAERGIEGARTVFFPRPTVDGVDVAAGDRGADVFCRNQGLGRAAWFDSSERAAQAIGPEGQYVGRSTVLRDLLCRKY